VTAKRLRAGGALDSLVRGLRARGTSWMVLGAFLAAIGAYVFQAIGTRSLGEIGYAPIGALWTIQYLVVSIVLYPIETYVTRRTLLRDEGDERFSPRIWGWIAAISLGLTAICWLFRSQLFHGMGDLALVVGLVTCTFGAFMVVRGRLAGTERFKAYGLVTATESVGRAVLAAVVVLVATTTRAIAWTMPFGALVAAALWLVVRRRLREPRALGAMPADAIGPARFLAITTGANGILQLLLAGGPLALVSLGGTPSEVSILFVTLMAARLPFMFFFSGVLSRLLPTFMRLAGSEDRRPLRRAASRVGIGTVALALVGGLAAAGIGGPLLGLLFGRAFAPPGWVAAGVTAGVLLATGSMILNQVLVAQGSPALSLSAWVLALVAAVAGLLVMGGDPTERVVGTFLIAETVALLGLIVGTLRLPSARPSGAESSGHEPRT
jgi:O-antigen/teichoic acid export membrane protein